MKRLSPDKRNKLLLTIMGTVAAIGAIYYLLIAPQVTNNGKIKSKILAQKNQLLQIQNTIKSAGSSTNFASEAAANLAQAEADVARGDLFAWTYDTIRKFKAGYKVDVPTIGQPVPVENDLFADFPFKQIKFSLNGTGYYHDIGKFIAGLENTFPHMRVINLAIEPAGGPDSTTEKLSFRMDVVVLVKPNT